MHYSNILLLALVATSSALPTGVKRSVDGDVFDLLDKREPGPTDWAKAAFNKVTGPKADAVVKTCQAGFYWTALGCVAHLAEPSKSKDMTMAGLGAAGLATTQDAMSKWRKVSDDAAKNKQAAAASKPAEDPEHQLVEPQPVTQPTTPAPAPKKDASTQTPPEKKEASTQTETPPTSPVNDPDEHHLPGHSRRAVEERWVEY